MAAPEHAKPLGKTGWEHQDGKPMTTEEIMALPTVTCEGCGWKGHTTDLLCVDPDENTTMWCPQCGTSSWLYD